MIHISIIIVHTLNADTRVPTHIRGMSVECTDQHDSYCLLLVVHLDMEFFLELHLRCSQLAIVDCVRWKCEMKKL